jgi:hypothetical protein
MTTFNGLTVECIERRARALIDRTDDADEWRYRSATGFLSRNEQLLHAIECDAATLARLGVSKEHVAASIRRILRPVRLANSAERRCVRRTAYNDAGEIVDVDTITYMSAQYSPFWNDAFEQDNQKDTQNDNSNDNDNDNDHNHNDHNHNDNQKWNVDCVITHRRSGIAVRVAGDDRCGIVHLIERYGFFEGGGASNPYRLDPDLLSVVTLGADVTDHVMRAVDARQARLLALARAQVRDAERDWHVAGARLGDANARLSRAERERDELAARLDRARQFNSHAWLPVCMLSLSITLIALHLCHGRL